MTVIAAEELSDLLDQLGTLRGAWAGTRQATGGLNAMAGFDFQLTRAIQAIIAQTITGAGRTYVEVLSDIVEADRGITVSQAKRTLTSGMLASALEELWSIHQLANTRTPKLVPHLKYKVLSARRVLVDWAGSMARWSPPGADATLLAEFKSRVAIDVSPDPRLEAATLLLDHFRDVDPISRIDIMVGRLMAASSDTLDRTVAEFVIGLKGLENAASQAELLFGLWSVRDRPPATVFEEPDSRYAVRIGERLRVRDLRDGCLAKRRVYDDIEARCEEWLAADGSPYKLPVFWVGGRSGCGKSAALLHLASRLHAQDADRIVLWLGENTRTIPEAVHWAAGLIREGRTVIVVLDDPFTAARQQDFSQAVSKAQDEWERLRDSAPPGSQPPMIVCCGPSEQRAAAEDACGTYAEFDGFEMPREAQEDLNELAAWYAARTGKPVEPMTGNVLMVQQVFEWTKGSIAEFATRFKDRIKGFDVEGEDGLFDTVAEILALNRLYVSYPSLQLNRKREADPSLDSALMQLGDEEEHFDFGGVDATGVRLTHPHLADAIYRRWFGRSTDRPFRRGHLAAALSASLADERAPPELRSAPLWAIGRLARSHDRHGRATDPAMLERIELIRPELHDVLRSIYASSGARTVRPLEDLPVWVGLDEEFGLALEPSPTRLLIEAIDDADGPVHGLRLSCHRLLSAKEPERENGLHARTVASCLTRLAELREPKPWHDWAPLAFDYVSRYGPAGVVDGAAAIVRRSRIPGLAQLMNAFAISGRADAASVVIAWLNGSADRESGRSTVLRNFIERNGHGPQTDVLCQRLFAASPDDEEWPRIWGLFEASDRGDPADVLSYGLAWLGLDMDRPQSIAHPDNFGWDRVWIPAVRRVEAQSENVAPLIAAGIRWASTSAPDNEAWPRVWAALWNRNITASERSVLVDIATTKLPIAPTWLGGWSHVWSPLVDAEISRSQKVNLIALARSWLQIVDPKHHGWPYVGERLLQHDDQEVVDDVLETALNWLSLTGNGHRGWTRIWQNVAQRLPTERREAFGSATVDWLDGSGVDHIGWPLVIEQLLLLDFGSHSEKAATLARSWLPSHSSNAAWSKVAEAWISHPSTREQRVELAADLERLLRGDGLDGGSWLAIWIVLRSMGHDPVVLAALAVRMLDQGLGNDSVRAGVCVRALGIEDVSSQAELVAHGLRLLGCETVERTWPYLWDRLVESGTKTTRIELVAMASEWLVRVGHGFPSWERVYLRSAYLDHNLPLQPRISKLATAWLSENGGSSKWLKIWRLLPDRQKFIENDSAFAMGVTALKDSTNREYGWIDLWEVLFVRSSGRGRRDLLQEGIDWVRVSSGRPGYHQIWQTMFTAKDTETASREELLALGLDAAGRVPIIPDWFKMFRALQRPARARLNEPAIVAAALQWLTGTRKSVGSWLIIVTWRMKIAPLQWQEKGLLPAADAWLRNAGFEHPQWSFVWQRIVSARVADETRALQDLGEAWLRAAPPTASGWPIIWIELWRLRSGVLGGRTALREMGRSWLSDHSGAAGADKILVRLEPARYSKLKTAPDAFVKGR